MTSFKNHISPATRRMGDDMLIRNMAILTLDSSTYHVDHFAKHVGKQPEDLGPEEDSTLPPPAAPRNLPKFTRLGSSPASQSS